MAADKRLLYFAVFAVIVTLAYIFFFCRSSEGFVTGGGLDSLGVTAGGCHAYDMINSESPMLRPDMNAFAGGIQEGYEPINEVIKYEPSDRYSNLLASTAMPKVDAGVTPFNVDVTNPQLYKYSVIPNLVQSGGLRSKYSQFDLRNMTIGDVPIRSFDIPLVGATTNSTGERQMGYLDQAGVASGGAYRNVQVSAAGAAQGGLGGTITDSGSSSNPFSM